MPNHQQKYKRRGAHLNPGNRFEKRDVVTEPEFLEYCQKEDDWLNSDQTEFIEVFPKSIVNKVDNADVPLFFSMNPYQGCEHGCIYCYARGTHEYWGYNAGSDFERKIMVKKNAAELLEKKLKSRSWEVHPIMLSGNTDCYQPAEAKYKITREILKVFLKHKHPVGIITKNAMILRDLDILSQLAALNLVHVNLSITSLNDETRKKLEPRTASVTKRLRTVKELSKAGVPVNVMFAPVVPGINSHEMIPLMSRVAELGARSAHYIVVRLNGHNGMLFEDWLERHYPDRKEKVLNQIKELHGGQVNDSRLKVRMSGEGKWAETLNIQHKFALKRYFSDKTYPGYDLTLFTKEEEKQTDQLKLF